MAEMLAIGPLGQIARKVRDIAAARLWYGETLGLKHLYSFGDLAFFDCGGTRLFLSQDENSDGSPFSIFVCRISARPMLNWQRAALNSSNHHT